MTDEQRLRLENLILLRATGEITPEEEATVDAAIAGDPVLAAFAKDLECLAIHGTTASRDFAAEAIAEAHPATAPVDFAARAIGKRATPTHYTRWVIAAAAAIALLFTLPALFDTQTNTASKTRHTVVISSTLDDIERELTLTKPNRFRRRS